MGAGRVRPERRRARPHARRAQPVPGPRRFGPASGVAVRRCDRSASGSCTATCTRSSMRTTRRRRFTACSRACRRFCASEADSSSLVLTTNYDDLVERALAEAGEPFDVVWYEAKRGPQQGRFVHRTPSGDVIPIERPNKYTGLALAERSRDPEAARRDRPHRCEARQLRDHRGQLHRLPRRRRRRRADPLHAVANGWRTATSSSSATRCATGTCA